MNTREKSLPLPVVTAEELAAINAKAKPPVSAEELAIVKRRLETLAEDEKAARPWPEVMRELRKPYEPT